MGKLGKIILMVLVVLGCLYLAAHIYVKHRLKVFLEQDLVSSQVSVGDLSLNLLSGSATASNLETLAYPDAPIEFKIDKASISGVGYANSLFADTLKINSFEMVGYEFRFRESDKKSTGKSSQRTILLKQLELQDGKIWFMDHDEPKMYFDLDMVDILDIVLATKNSPPIAVYHVKHIQSDSTFIKLNKRENLYLGQMNLYQDSINVKKLALITNDSVQALVHNETINYDILQLQVPTLSLHDYELKLTDTTQFTARRLELHEPNFESYANANLETGNPSPTYHELLREMKTQIRLDTLVVVNGKVTYSEPHATKPRRGSIYFDQINGNIQRLSNLPDHQPIALDMSTRFMGNSQVQVNLTMDVYSELDKFLIKADIHDFDVASINEFVVPVLDMRLEGTVEDYFFTLDGQRDNGFINSKISYNGLKIDLLTNKGQPKWLISGIANSLIIKNSAKAKTVEAQKSRDRSKTLFNYIWKIQEKALRKVIM
jgi:hypothetical protein